MKIKTTSIAFIIVAVIFVTIAVTEISGLWSTASEKTPDIIQNGTSGSTYDPSDIKGSYTFNDVSDFYKIDLQVLYKAFNIPQNTDGSAIKIKDINTFNSSQDVEIGPGSMKIFVALYNNLPIELDGSYLPKQAAEIILQVNTNLTDEQKNYLISHTLK